jgi:hypothetical protein
MRQTARQQHRCCRNRCKQFLCATQHRRML